MVKKGSLILLLLGFFISAYAQDEDAVASADAQETEFEQQFKEKYVILSDDMRSKNYTSALKSINWLLEREEEYRDSEPIRHRNVYLHAVRAYQSLYSAAAKSGEAAKTEEYQDKMLEIYQRRINQDFDKDDKLSLILTRGKYLYRFLKDRENVEKADMYKEYQDIFNVAGNQIDETNLTFYMVLCMNMTINGKNAAVRLRNKEIGIAKAQRDNDAAAEASAEAEVKEYMESDEYLMYKDYDEDWMLNRYDEISEVIAYNIENTEGEERASWEDTKGKIDGLLPQVVEITCEFVTEKYSDILQNEPKNIDVAKKALKYMLQAKCTDDPLFIFAARNTFSAEPTAGMASVISSKFNSSDELDSAMYWKEKAIELSADDPIKQADHYMDLAKMNYKKGVYSKARSMAYKAVELDPEKASDAYELIGDLYMSSYNTCDEGDAVEQRAVFLAAYDMYSKSGNSKKMANARAQFPSTQDVFTLAGKGYAEGKAIKVDCWINTSTTIRVRPKD